MASRRSLTVENWLCCVLVSGSFLVPNGASAQTYSPGDRVTVIHWDAEFKLSSNVVGTADVGESFVVAKVEGNWLGMEGRQGYLHRSDVVAYAEAIEYFTAIIRQDPTSSAAYHDRATVWSSRGEYDIAVADYTEAIRLYVDAASYDGRGRARHLQGDLDGAIADYNEAIRLDPSSANAYHNRGNAWSDRGDLERAITDYNEAIRLDPDYADAYINRGVARKRQDDLDGAIADYTEAIRLDPTIATAYYSCGNARIDQGDLEHAIADYNEAIRLDPNFASAYYNRGNAWNRQGDLEHAIADYTDAIRLDPNYASAYCNRGNAWSDQGDLERAIADYTEAIRLDPQHENALGNLAWTLATCPDDDLRDGQLAVAYATQACELTEWSQSNYLDTLAAACAEAGQFAEAVEWQTKAIELAENEDSDDLSAFQSRLELYQAGMPYREPDPNAAEAPAPPAP